MDSHYQTPEFSIISLLEYTEAGVDPLSKLLLSGAQKLIFQAVDAELYVCLEQHSERRTESGNSQDSEGGGQTGEPATF